MTWKEKKKSEGAMSFPMATTITAKEIVQLNIAEARFVKTTITSFFNFYPFTYGAEKYNHLTLVSEVQVFL